MPRRFFFLLANAGMPLRHISVHLEGCTCMELEPDEAPHDKGATAPIQVSPIRRPRESFGTNEFLTLQLVSDAVGQGNLRDHNAVSTFGFHSPSGCDTDISLLPSHSAELGPGQLCWQLPWDANSSINLGPLPASTQSFGGVSWTTNPYNVGSTSDGSYFFGSQSAPPLQSFENPITDSQDFSTTPVMPHLVPNAISDTQYGGLVDPQVQLAGPVFESDPGMSDFYHGGTSAFPNTFQESAYSVPRNQQSHTFSGTQALHTDDTRPNEHVDVVSTGRGRGASRILCLKPGCTQSFRRRADMDRHLLGHSSGKRRCPVVGCQRMLRAHRGDKLKDHLRRGHKIDSEEMVNGLYSSW